MRSSCVLVLSYFLVINGHNLEKDKCPNIKNSLSSIRKRRHLAFPDNSNAVITISLAKALHTHVPSGWMIVMDLDVNYPLPTMNFTLAHARRKLHHRQKKDMWQRMKSALDLHNVNGDACILRSICEARTHLAPKGQSLVHDLLRAIFTAPSLEEGFREELGGSFDEVLDPELCERTHECPISLLSFIFDLNRPPKDKP